MRSWMRVMAMENSRTLDKIISEKILELVEDEALRGLVKPGGIYMSPPEFKQRLSYCRFSIPELVKLCNSYSSKIEIERPAPHKVYIDIDREVQLGNV